MTMEHTARARASTNIALVKYWGKRDAALNLPAAGSLSLTLAGLGTETSVRFVAGRPSTEHPDRVTLDGRAADDKAARRVSRFLDLVRARAALPLAAEVVTANNIPTAAGLASSASGFAALALAATAAAGLTATASELSELARRGSGSAARSIFGGFVEMHAGEHADGRDAIARPLLAADAWDVRLVVAIATEAAKAIGSTEAMDRTARTSPYYAPWIASVAGDLDDARAAIATRDLERLGRVAERSCLRMHASAMAADPGIVYWNSVTLSAIETVRELRRTGTAAFFTIDAGPHVKVLCGATDERRVQDALAATPGVLRTLTAAPGPDAARTG